jgi:iron complex outermembrane receptor protein
LGNPNLKPEHGFSGEFGVDFKHKQALWQSLLSASFFNIKTKNWILWQPLDGVWRPYNIETVWSRGLETQAKWEYKQGDFATQCTIQYQMTLSTDENGYQILFIPVHSASFSMRLNYKNTYLNFNENYSGKRYMTSDNATWTSAFALSNLTLGWSPNVKFTHCNLSFQINNIFNTNYQTIRFFAMPRRTWVITLNVSF